MRLLQPAHPSALRLTLLSLSLTQLATALHIRQADSIRSCVQALSPLFPNDITFATESKAFNARLTPSPTVIVFPTDAQQVEAAVKCGSANNLPVVARSGGHSYAAYGLGGTDGALVIDLSALNQISLSGEDALVGTGNRLGDVAAYLWQNGQRVLPHGTCPKVGTGGHTSFGGYGPFSRVGGLTLDRVKSCSVVLANGTSVTASATSNPDLFWAIRGAAPSFGIVTSWTYATLPAPPTTVFFGIGLPAIRNAAGFQRAFSAYQTFIQTVPDKMAMAFSFGKDGDALVVTLIGNFFGTGSDFDALAQQIMSSIPGSTINERKVLTDWTQVQVENAYGEALQTPGESPPNTFFAKSLTTSGPFSDSALTSWGEYLFSILDTEGLSWFIQADHYGGAISAVPPSATSFGRRNALLVIQFYGSSVDNAPFESDWVGVIDGMVSSLAPEPEGAYANYVDPTLSTEQWQKLYFGSNIRRLSGLKALYDPGNVFRFPQSIPIGSVDDATAEPTSTEATANQGSTAYKVTPDGARTLLLLFVALGFFYNL